MGALDLVLDRHQRPAPHQLHNNPQAVQPTLSSFTALNVPLLPLHSDVPRIFALQNIIFPDDVQEMRDPEARDEPAEGRLRVFTQDSAGQTGSQSAAPSQSSAHLPAR